MQGHDRKTHSNYVSDLKELFRLIISHLLTIIFEEPAIHKLLLFCFRK